MKVRSITSAAALILTLVTVVSARPVAAAEQTYTACPTSASAWIYDSSKAYPPYTTASSEDPSPLVGCSSSFDPTEDTVSIIMGYEVAGLPQCGDITALSLTSTGTPGLAGWGFLAFRTADSSPLVGLSGTGDGAPHQYGLNAGDTLTVGSAEFYSPINQPSDGSYSVTYDLDPTGVTIDDLTNGAVSVSAIGVDPGDTIESLTLSVTIDDSPCNTTTTTESTTTTTEATTTTTAQPVAAVVTPRFTG